MKRIVAVLAVAGLFFGAEAASLPKKNSSDKLIEAEYAILTDAETGDCLFEKNGDKRCHPSSMTKLMTIYLLFSAVASGRIKLDDRLPVSKAAQKAKGSRSFFRAGTTAVAEDLIRSIIVHSGNDASIAAAEGISGDVDVFTEEMNEKASEFGLKNTHFVNPSGIPDEDHFSSVRDLATICRRIIADFPQFYHYFSEKTFTVNSITQQNRNTLLGNSLGVDGLKTGKTDAGGYGVAVSAENDGKRLIVVVNGCKTAQARAKDANKLLALGFKEFSRFKIAESGKPISEIAVLFGVKERIGLCTHKNIILSVPKKDRKSLKVEAIMTEPLEAPVDRGVRAGELICRYGDGICRRYPLFTCESTERVGFWEKIKLSLKHLIFGSVRPATTGIVQ
jgi:D-alanyl-D-alanine carboxypeptidase (penicillin-binding protein 5/6)